MKPTSRKTMISIEVFDRHARHKWRTLIFNATCMQTHNWKEKLVDFMPPRFKGSLQRTKLKL